VALAINTHPIRQTAVRRPGVCTLSSQTNGVVAGIVSSSLLDFASIIQHQQCLAAWMQRSIVCHITLAICWGTHY
jgi:hypothetical protein